MNMPIGKHRCVCRGCNAVIPDAKLMCFKHWQLVPARLKGEVWRTYRLGQEDDHNPSREYIAAARKAIEAVAQIESAERQGDSGTLIV